MKNSLIGLKFLATRYINDTCVRLALVEKAVVTLLLFYFQCMLPLMCISLQEEWGEFDSVVCGSSGELAML